MLLRFHPEDATTPAQTEMKDEHESGLAALLKLTGCCGVDDCAGFEDNCHALVDSHARGEQPDTIRIKSCDVGHVTKKKIALCQSTGPAAQNCVGAFLTAKVAANEGWNAKP